MADKYDPIRLVGKGSFGSVYLVSRRRDQAQFVLKNMQIKNVPEKEIESYQNEVRLLTELEHPGIVSHVESFIDGDKQHMCIVMGYCEGGDLAAYLKHKKGVFMREGEILYHFVQMALALLYMHEKNILHRDLKTQNIFIKNGLIQLGDFGISKALTGSNDFAQTCIGTPYYMSPELFQNKPYNFKSDVWALGCVLYEMMTYKHAFDASSINGLAQKILKGQVSSLPTTFSKSIRTLVKQMLDLEPKKRPSMMEILQQPFLKKHIRTYVTAVLINEQTYRPQNIINFKAQLRRIGLEDCLQQPPPEPVYAQPSSAAVPALPIASAQSNAGSEKASARSVVSTARSENPSKPSAPAQPSSSSASASAAAAQRERDRIAAEKAAVAAARHKEQAARLVQLQEEERERKALEEKLTKLKRAHEQKQKVLDSKKTVASASSNSRPGSAKPVVGSKLKPSNSQAKLPTPAPVAAAPVPQSSSASKNVAGVAAVPAKRPPSASGVPARNPSSSPSLSSIPASVEPDVLPISRPISSSSSSRSSAASQQRSLLADERQKRLDREREEHEHALRLREAEELRAAAQARLLEAERIDARRKQLELAKKKKQEVEALAIAQREKELEKVRMEELARQRKVLLAQAQAEKAELERIQLDKQWISKRLDDLASKPIPAPSVGHVGGKKSGVKNFRDESSDELTSASAATQSAKDRVLAEKAAKRDAQIEAEHQQLLQGRKEAFQDRLKVQQKSTKGAPQHLQSNVAVVGSSPSKYPATSTHLTKQDSETYEDDFESDRSHVSGGGAYRNPPSTTDEDLDSEELVDDDSENEEELAQEAQEIEEVEHLLLGLTKNIQDLRTSIQVPAQFEAAHEQDVEVDEEEDGGMDYGEDESENESEEEMIAQQQLQEVKEVPIISESMLQRMKALAKECAKLVGRNKFVDAFEYLKHHLTDSKETKIAELTKILGKEKVKHWEKIDQLVFMERTNSNE